MATTNLRDMGESSIWGCCIFLARLAARDGFGNAISLIYDATDRSKSSLVNECRLQRFKLSE